MGDILKLNEELKEQIISDYKYLHEYPELSNCEKNTSEYVEKRLLEIGIEVKKGYAGYGLQGMIWGNNPNGKTIMLRADMDALALEENTDIEYCSKINGVMHACGHDAHTASLLGAAKLLSDNKDKLNGNVKLCFQPAEEGDGGARKMIEDGIMENPKVDYAFGLHVDPNMKVGQVAVESGEVTSYPNFFEFTVTGKGGHGAYPHFVNDPIRPLTVIYSILSGIRSEIPSGETCVIQICKINAGTALAVVPDKGIIGGTTRTVTAQSQKLIKERFEQIAKQIENLYPVKCELSFKGVSKPVFNTPEFVEPVKQWIKPLFIDFTSSEFFKTGGEDFCFYCDEVPTTFIFVGCANDNKDTQYALHNSKFKIDLGVLEKAAMSSAAVAVNYLNS